MAGANMSGDLASPAKSKLYCLKRGVKLYLISVFVCRYTHRNSRSLSDNLFILFCYE